jgi:hypothetical protein
MIVKLCLWSSFRVSVWNNRYFNRLIAFSDRKFDTLDIDQTLLIKLGVCSCKEKPTKCELSLLKVQSDQYMFLYGHC